MNEYDSELIRSILQQKGYGFVEDDGSADIVMLNTCAIRENAHRKVYGKIHEIRHRRNGKPLMIGILGCMATNLRQELLDDRNLKIDFIAGPDSYKRLPELIEQAALEGEKPYDLTLSEFETYSDVYPRREKGVNAWVAVMRGCNNFCSFCVVPYTRGRERSRSVENVVDEVRHIAEEGFRQVTLLGQNVNSYFHEGRSFAALLDAVSRVEGIERVRFTSPHPKDFPDDLIEVIAGNPKVCKQIHLPLQAGSDRILEQMNRTYTSAEFLALVDKLRSRIPGLCLSTDIIVGFSSETDKEFEDTVRLMETITFDSAFIFKYSERRNTIASKQYPDDVPEKAKTKRIVRLNEIQKGISLKRNSAHIGRTETVLIEEKGTSRSSGHFTGRNDGNTIVIIPEGPYTPGTLLNIKIDQATPHVLKGIPV